MRLSLIFCLICFSTCLFAQTFSNVADSKGISQASNDAANHGCGISFCDFDGDGDDDLTFGTGVNDSIFFYQNNGGVFQKIPSPVDYKNLTKQILWVDYDNDGDKDLYVATFEGRNKLYQNDGSFQFTDVTTSVGLAPLFDPTSGANFGDFDNDGWLDLYITNYTFPGGSFTNYMFRNNNGTFVNETFSTGTGNGIVIDLVSVFFDFNDDGFEDIYISADRTNTQNKLLKNNGDGTFSDVTVASNTDLWIDAMNCGVGDIDNDGDLDLYVSNTPTTGNVMLQNNGDETFTDVTTTSGTAFNRIGWAGNFLDFDNDLDLDLYVSSSNTGPGNQNALYVNDGSGVFTEPLSNGFPGDTVPSFCNVVGDFNDDGMLDLAVSHNDTFRFHLWENQNPNSNNYIKFDLEGQTCNRDAYGTKVEIFINGNKYIRSKHCGEGYLGQISDKVHFGLGAATTIDSVIVKWLGGNIDKYYNVAANQTFAIQESLSGPLPVELINFFGKNLDKEILLQWNTAAEINFQGFEIQRSFSGLTYERLGFIEGKSNTQNHYTFFDKNIERGRRHYYRLKMMDKDGAFEYSKVVVIEVASDQFEVSKIFPNPAETYVEFEYNSPSNYNGHVKIIDLNGKVVLEKFIEIEEGSHLAEIALSELPSGNYFLVVEGKFPIQKTPFFIQRK